MHLNRGRRIFIKQTGLLLLSGLFLQSCGSQPSTEDNSSAGPIPGGDTKITVDSTIVTMDSTHIRIDMA